jgi:hypothetical protein
MTTRLFRYNVCLAFSYFVFLFFRAFVIKYLASSETLLEPAPLNFHPVEFPLLAEPPFGGFNRAETIQLGCSAPQVRRRWTLPPPFPFCLPSSVVCRPCHGGLSRRSCGLWLNVMG